MPEELKVLLDDDFSSGLTADRWSHAAIGPLMMDDGVVTTAADGLRVVAKGVNDVTGEPAFTSTLPREEENGYGLTGALDHLKWLAYAKHDPERGLPGFDAEPGWVLTFESWLSGCTYGTALHPFGDTVSADDHRLAAIIITTVDPATGLVFNFLLTNDTVYAQYERLDIQRSRLGEYAAFNYLVPVARRTPADKHHLAISFDRSGGVVRWLVNGTEVFRIDRPGTKLPERTHLTEDHGGTETVVESERLNCGMGLVTRLDGAAPGQSALVRLSSAEAYYFATDEGAPKPQEFFDDKSLPANRLFGQGAELTLTRYRVTSSRR
ncbi:DUF6081 family protein [Nocardia sp. CC227C]|uniref:DUF6081 family protein n=1 Tax=Nocardia sp. CC227C TaxID=3044562 RepID=UPI00278BC38E|nr:DUF6081 family protein [Nocardia sp. CC227C]